MVNENQVVPQQLQKVLETGILSVEIPETITIGYRLLGSTKESNWNPGKEFDCETGVKSALKRRAPGFAKDTSGAKPTPQPKLFVTDATSFPGLRLVYIHPDASSEQIQELKSKLDTPPAVSAEEFQVQVPNPALYAIV